MSTDRRGFLGALGAAAAGAALPARPAPSRPTADLEELATLVRKTARDDLVRTATRLHADGVPWRDLLGAAFLAGIHDVRPRPVGFQFHCVMMTASALQVGDDLGEDARLLAALFNLDDFKAAQARDAREHDWELPAAPPLEPATRDAALRELGAALDAWDEERADRAAIQAARSASLDDTFEVLWRFGARDFGNIGHKAIFVAQACRTLQQIGWRHGEPVVRSIVHALLAGRPGENDATFAPNLERAQGLGRHVGTPQTAASVELLRALRTVEDARGAADLVVEQLGAGIAVESVEDGLRLFAAELVLRQPGIVAVHAVTSLNALLYVRRRSTNAVVQRLTLLQAASWQVLYPDLLKARAGAPPTHRIEALEPTEAEGDPREVFDRLGEDRLAAAALALGHATAGRSGELAHLARELLVRKVRGHHDYKFTAALLEEVRLADPAIAPPLLAAGTAWLVPASADDAPVYRRHRGL